LSHSSMLLMIPIAARLSIPYRSGGGIVVKYGRLHTGCEASLPVYCGEGPLRNSPMEILDTIIQIVLGLLTIWLTWLQIREHRRRK
jgi:hypothetical protein